MILYKYLLHISDIHIRLHERHEEYRSVFDALYKELKKYENAIIVLTGDLFHNKDKLSPGSLTLGQEFLVNLCHIHPVVLIAGNHDCVLQSDEKIDTISALLKYINSDRIHYFPYTTTYQMSNVLFCVNSRMDNKFINCKEIDKPQCVKIGLYHGIVGCIKQGKVVLSGIDPKKFDGFDAVLLGDIHQPMFINDNQTMAYASSLISQNYGESHAHGFIVWKIQDKQIQGEFHEIHNDYAYVTIEIHDRMTAPKSNNHFFVLVDGEIGEMKIPKFAKIRIVLYTDKNVQNIIKQLQEKYASCAFVVTKDLKKAIAYIDHANWLFDVKNLNVDNFCNKFIEANDLDSSILEQTDFIKIKKSLKLKQLEENIENNWDICCLRFKNLMGYTSEQKLNFNIENHNVYGLIAPNSSGKSSIIDIIAFVLYGKFARDIGSDASQKVLNNSSVDGYGELILKCGSKFYNIVKKLKKRKDDTTSTKIEFYQLFVEEQVNSSVTVEFNGEFMNGVNICAETKTKTEQKIASLVGSFANFLSTSTHLPSPSTPAFLSMHPVKRKAYVLDLLDMNISDELYTSNHNELILSKKQLSSYLLEIEKFNIGEINEQITIIKAKIANLAFENTKIQLEIEKIENLQTLAIQNQHIYAKKSHIEKTLNSYYNDKDELRKKIEETETNRICLEKQKDGVLDLINNKDKIVTSKKVLEAKIDRKLQKYRKNLKKIVDSMPPKSQMTEYEKQIFDKFCSRSKDNKLPHMHELEDELKSLVESIQNVDVEQLCENKGKLISELEFLPGGFSESNKNLDSNAIELLFTTHENEKNSLLLQIEQLECSLHRLQTNRTEHRNRLDEFTKTIYSINEKLSMNDAAIDSSCQVLVEMDTMKFNPECECCMKNPHYLMLEDTKKKLKTLHKNKHELSLLLQTNENEATSVTALLSSLNIENDNLTKKLLEKKTLGVEIEKKMTALEKEKENIAINIKKGQLKRNIEVITDQCKFAADIQKKIQNIRTEIDELSVFLKVEHYYEQNEKRKLDLDKISILTDKIHNLETYNHEEYENLLIALTTNNNTESQLQVTLASLQNLNDSCTIINEKIQDFEKKLAHICQNENCGSYDNAELSDRLHELHLKKADILGSTNNYEKELLQLNDRSKIYNELNNKYNIENEHKNKLVIYDKILGKNGITLYLLQQILPMVEEQTNTILQKYINKKIELCIINDNIHVNLISTDKKNVASVFGGMETFLIEISIKLSFAHIIKVPRSSFIFIDEAFSVFDQQNISKAETLIDIIKEHFNTCILVTHDSRISDLLSKHIGIENNCLIMDH